MNYFGKTIAIELVGPWEVTAVGQKGISAEDFDGYLAHIHRRKDGIKGTVVYTGEGSLDAVQRERLEDAVKNYKHAYKNAILSSSRVVRLAMVAMSWFNPAVKVFDPKDLSGAFDYLGVPEADRATVLSTLGRLRGMISEPPP